MTNSKLALHSFLHSAGVLVYILLVSVIMRNAEKIFGKTDTFFSPVAFLMLFVFSALVTGILVLGRPAYLFLHGQKDEAVKFLGFTVGWMFLLVIVAFGLLLLAKTM
ncbi:MAG: hypothetical protein WCW77_02925 [Patescibacteria group bacterium]|jgi:hypothetical protein